ncbi:MAG: hypothetical protein ABFC62_00415 [Clostridiaceae bacterium]|nr:hypothetical protein [Eubacteriales bacterium]
MSQHTIVKFPYDSHIRYLPLVYFLPEDRFVRYPLLSTLPRDLSELSNSPAKMKLITGKAFLKDIMDATAALVFPHFGFGGWLEHYTGYFPAWRLSYLLPLWAKLLEKETGWGVQALFQVPPHTEIPFLKPEYIKAVMERVVKRAIGEENWQPVLDVVKEMPCDEDFMKWNTNVRTDFLRKWYHTRSKVQMVSLEACMEDEEHGIHEIEDISDNFEDRIVAEDFCQRFKARLSEKDMKILELRVEGFTYEEIAAKLGYKNHSGVIKRIQSITKAFVKYEEEQQ